MHKSLLTTIFLLAITCSFAQQPTLQQKLQSNLNLQSQFQVLLAQSKSFDADFKVIRKANIEIIQKNVSDSISKYTKEIATLKSNSSSSVANLTLLKDSLQTTQAALAIEQRKTDNITFLGIDLSKGVYHSIVWAIIAILALVLMIIIASFRKAKIDAVESKKTAEESQQEFQVFKKKAMETEQKLKRQLLDEQLKGNS
ncbi:hypothetical protein [Sphingobacterium rhinopitheci]|uniref:hypothetical protein n=1 Tax=Sphingobacterium rhinopitheci TaxID=2781960 RepID=UPI001F516A6D|nr:hypothetical protein [Sphingobacterium rhinopitheci]MCI0920928.1 hypothetical protein [Sphingobacterium rhinopitheci]